MVYDTISPKKKPKPDDLPGERSKRVFVGGDYDFMADLRMIAEYVRKMGYIAISAWDFDVKEDKIYHTDVLLMMNCAHAIFEVTSEAGQLIELAEVLFQIDSLSLFLFKLQFQS